MTLRYCQSPIVPYPPCDCPSASFPHMKKPSANEMTNTIMSVVSEVDTTGRRVWYNTHTHTHTHTILLSWRLHHLFREVQLRGWLSIHRNSDGIVSCTINIMMLHPSANRFTLKEYGRRWFGGSKKMVVQISPHEPLVAPERNRNGKHKHCKSECFANSLLIHDTVHS